MKRGCVAWLLLCSLFVVCLPTFSESVTLGVWGYVKVQIPAEGGVNLVGFNFSSEATRYLGDVFSGSSLTSNSDPDLADLVYVWDAASESYKRYFQKPDGLFYDVDDPNGDAVLVEVQSGDALFLKSPVSATEATSVYLTGSVSLDAVQSCSYASKVVFANVYPTEMNLNSSDLDWSSATAGELPTTADQVHIWDPDKEGGPGYQNYFLKSIDGENQWCSGESPFDPADPVIPPGGGAFYTAVGSSSLEIIRPFDI